MSEENEFEIENKASIDIKQEESNKGFLTTAPQNAQKALEKIDNITKILDSSIRLSLQRTYAQDWVKMGDKYYLQASGVEKIRGIFGIYFRDRETVKEVFKEENADGTLREYYAYITTGKAGSKLLDSLYGEATIEIEGIRSSIDPFFTAKGRSPDPMDVRKASFANFQVRAVKALLGLGNYTAKDLQKFGVTVSEVTEVKYEKGAEGGGNPDVISDPQRKRLFAICKAKTLSTENLKVYLKQKFKIDSTEAIKRKDYEAICTAVESGSVFSSLMDGEREPGEI